MWRDVHEFGGWRRSSLYPGTSVLPLDSTLQYDTLDHVVSFLLLHGNSGINPRLLMIEATLCTPHSTWSTCVRNVLIFFAGDTKNGV